MMAYEGHRNFFIICPGKSTLSVDCFVDSLFVCVNVIVFCWYVSLYLVIILLLYLSIVGASLFRRSTIRTKKMHLLILLSSCCREVGRFLKMLVSWCWFCPLPRFLYMSSWCAWGPMACRR